MRALLSAESQTPELGVGDIDEDDVEACANVLRQLPNSNDYKERPAGKLSGWARF